MEADRVSAELSALRKWKHAAAVEVTAVRRSDGQVLYRAVHVADITADSLPRAVNRALEGSD